MIYLQRQQCLILIFFIIFIVSSYSQCGIGYQGSPCIPIVNTAFTVAYTGSNQNYVVPNGINLLEIKLWGGGGGGSYWTNGGTTFYGGGAGGFASCYLAVTPGETLNIIVAGAGISCNTGPSVVLPGGFGGGGTHNQGQACCGSGGGRSAIQALGYKTPDAYDDIITAGGIIIFIYYHINCYDEQEEAGRE